MLNLYNVPLMFSYPSYSQQMLLHISRINIAIPKGKSLCCSIVTQNKANVKWYVKVV